MARRLHGSGMRLRAELGATLLLWGLPAVAVAVTLAGGGSRRNDCLVELAANGLGYLGGAVVFTGTTCADGDVCDADGLVDGACLFTPTVCLNAADPVLPRCNAPAVISRITFKGTLRGNTFDTSARDAAVAALGLPSSAVACSPPVALVVPVGDPNKRGELVRSTAQVRAKAKTTKGADKDRYRFTCVPAVGPGATVTTTTTTGAASPTMPGATTTLPAATPGDGLAAAITAASIDTAGRVVVTFRLTDAAGVVVVPRTGAASAPNEARVRFTIARLEVLPHTAEGVTTTFTRYVNYVTGSAAGGSQPTYDTTGTFTLVDAASGTWTYTFDRMLPAGLPRNLTHTVGAQVERVAGDAELVANPLLDFVPDGSPVTVVREVTTTAQCNACHDPLAVHGGGRREVTLCQLCHTDQAIDPESGNQIDLKHMVHRIHMGRALPSVVDGPVGARFAIIGLRGGENRYAEKVRVCASGPFETTPCESDTDCAGSPCSGTGSVGVAFPQDIRNCATCHSAGATAADHLAQPSTLACTGCRDDVNPGETVLNGLLPGTGHVADDQPDVLCRVCHGAVQDEEFDETVPGAHVNPLRSAALAGLQGEILSASGSAGMPVMLTFRLRDGTGDTIESLAGFDRVAFAVSGPTADFGAHAPPVLTAVAVGGGSSGTLAGPDGDGVFTYVTAAALPAEAAKTWRAGLEARRSTTVNGQAVSEAVPNPVLDFSVDGSPVVARRTVVANEKCGSCHGTFSKDLSVHGNLRNRMEYCVVCHNPSGTDFARRANAVGAGADPATASIDLEQMIHKIHRGDALERPPYLIYGFGSAPKGYTAHDFGEVRFPGDLRDCETCHVAGTQTLPLPPDVLPTLETVVNGGAEQVVGSIPPVTDACTSCHDSDEAVAHARANTTATGAEACAVCHDEGSVAAVSVVHAPEP
jgi:OmcA/MtrC family decaheme c-type cytochrome